MHEMGLFWLKEKSSFLLVTKILGCVLLKLPPPPQEHCCGLIHGYEDWGYNISESCWCQENSTKPCVSVKATQCLF